MILQTHNLSKQYLREKVPFYAVDHINFQAEKGEFICIAGNSGSGKSTFFNLMAGVLTPSDGSVVIDGADLAKSSQKELSEIRRTKIGYIMQGQNLLHNFNAEDNLYMPYYLSGRKAVLQNSASDLLEYVGLSELKHAYPSQLSGGELRRVAIARALLLSPVIVLADEPTGNLDFENALKIIELFKKISSEGTTVIVSTHDMEFLKYATRAFKMAQGKLCACS